MSGLALLFMLFFWSFIISLATYCLTLIFFEKHIKEGKRRLSTAQHEKTG